MKSKPPKRQRVHQTGGSPCTFGKAASYPDHWRHGRLRHAPPNWLPRVGVQPDVRVTRRELPLDVRGRPGSCLAPLGLSSRTASPARSAPAEPVAATAHAHAVGWPRGNGVSNAVPRPRRRGSLRQPRRSPVAAQRHHVPDQHARLREPPARRTNGRRDDSADQGLLDGASTPTLPDAVSARLRSIPASCSGRALTSREQ